MTIQCPQKCPKFISVKCRVEETQSLSVNWHQITRLSSKVTSLLFLMCVFSLLWKQCRFWHRCYVHTATHCIPPLWPISQFVISLNNTKLKWSHGSSRDLVWAAVSHHWHGDDSALMSFDGSAVTLGYQHQPLIKEYKFLVYHNLLTDGYQLNTWLQTTLSAAFLIFKHTFFGKSSSISLVTRGPDYCQIC